MLDIIHLTVVRGGEKDGGRQYKGTDSGYFIAAFSQYGFSAVSIRDICGQVHIKESSVYYHFTNKRAILEELGNRFEMIAGGLMQRLDDAVAQLQGEGGSGISGGAAAKVFSMII